MSNYSSLETQREIGGKATKHVRSFLLSLDQEGPSVAESYWVNTKLFPALRSHLAENDPIAAANLNASLRSDAVIESVIVSSGKVYNDFPTTVLPRPLIP